MRELFKKVKKENGQSVVELAIVLPLFLLLICAIIDFGWLFYNNISVNNCAREGARYAMVAAGTTDAVQQTKNRITSVAPEGIKTKLTITVVYSNTQSPKLGDVTVTVKANIPVLTPILGIYYKNQVVPVTSKTTVKVN